MALTFDQMREKCGLEPFDTYVKQFDTERRTGRTTRMVIQAFTDIVQHGKPIVFVFPTIRQAMYEKPRILKMAEQAGLDTKLVHVDSIEYKGLHRGMDRTLVPDHTVAEHAPRS